MFKKLAAIFALLLGVGFVAAPAANAYTGGQVWVYVNSNYRYGGPLAATYQLGNTDCTDSRIAGMTFWTGNGTGVGGVISSLNANVGNRVNCNVIGVKSWSPNGGVWLTQCMSHNNGGIAGFGAPWNDNSQFVAIWHYGGCPAYWA